MEQTFPNHFQRIWYAPAFSSLLEDRTELVMICGAAGLHLTLNLAGYQGWQCPILAATGIPCPGCGLTTAMVQLLHGHIRACLHTHAFAPLLAVALMILFGVLVLPESPRRRIITSVSSLETRTGITAWGLCILLLYWVIRLIA